jgi:hypothetical protein
MEQKAHFNVLIATPGRNFVPEYVESVMDTCAWLSSQGLTYKFLNKYSSFVPSARELTATNTYSHDYDTNEIGCGKFTYDKIVWIDSDISWDVDTFKKLFESDKEIISGIYQTGPSGIVALALPDDDGLPRKVNKVEFLLWEDPFEVLAVGFGFVAMKSGVFENIKRPWFLVEKIKWPSVPFETNVGEDYSWCMRARNAGYKIWADPTITVLHHKDTIYRV